MQHARGQLSSACLRTGPAGAGVHSAALGPVAAAARAWHHPPIGRAPAATAATAAAPHLPSRLPEREPYAGTPGAPAAPAWGSPLVVGGLAVEPSWLSYAWWLDGSLPLLYDPAVERLRRQLGMGGRWAWQDEREAAEAADEEPGQAAEQRQARRAAGSTHEARGRMPGGYLPSQRGRGRRRNSGQRRCRGHALAGATELGAEGWLHSSLPEDLRDLALAGMDALARAAANYEPGRDIRFSTYACASIQNAMLGVLAGCERAPGGSWQLQPVHVPPHARGLAASVQRAAYQVQQQKAMAAVLAGTAAEEQCAAQQDRQQQLLAEPAAQQRDKEQEHEKRLQQSEPASLGLQQLSRAAQLSVRQTALGLAAARRQWVASRDSQVPVDSVEGGLARRPDRQMARFSDLQEEVHPCDGEAARSAVEQVLARLRPKQRRLLLLRFGLEGAERCSEAAELDFGSLGRVLGLSRQRVQTLYCAALMAAQREAAMLGML
ncbi:hypothetical protein ABPG75_011176 [Micractinium tetrahymenae]